MDMVETQGKQNKRVQILLTPDMVRAIYVILAHRPSCGTLQNKYVFANQGQGHLNYWSVLRNLATEAKCEAPNRMTSTVLRKYVATVTQVNETYVPHIL